MPRVSTEYRTASRSTFKRFQEAHPNVDITYNTWCNIIYTFNYNFREYLLTTGTKAKYPYGFGDFAITKWRPLKKVKLEDGKEIISLPVDWKKTKEYGEKIYHMNYNTEGHKFKWQWFLKKATFYKSDIWMFKPSRQTSRLLKHYLDIPGQHHKYHQWKT